MPDKPPFFFQQRDDSCAVACLRMVLAAYEIEKTEEEIYALCDCGIEGTDALKLVDAARQLGLPSTRKYNLTLDELKEEIVQGRFPIVYVRMRIIRTHLLTQHALIVIAVNHDKITVLDPLEGERKIPITEFQQNWRRMRGLTILCQ